jgi:hypothetical protein
LRASEQLHDQAAVRGARERSGRSLDLAGLADRLIKRQSEKLASLLAPEFGELLTLSRS